jgi:REP element-mobilizing transposase RayT
MGMQISCIIHTELPTDGALCATAAGLGPVVRDFAEQTECQVEDGHLMPHHLYMLLSVPPKYWYRV